MRKWPKSKVRFFIFLPIRIMCYTPENRPTPTYPNIGDFIGNGWFPKSRIDPNETRIRELEREVAELRRYKEEQEEKENPKVRQYRKKPVVVEAVRFTTETNLRKSFPDIEIWNGMPDSVIEVYIKTLEGKVKISEWDYIIKGIKGEYYPCKPDIFEDTYERA